MASTLETVGPTLKRRYAPENVVEQLFQALADFAASKSATPAQIALAWALHKGDDIIPIMGARKRTQLGESLAALDVQLSPADIAQLEAIAASTPVAGTRYDAAQMRMLDSERV